MSTSGQCIGCKNYTMMSTCEAFPDKIPYKIISGHFIHTEPYPGDHGIMYDPIDSDEEPEAEAAADQKSVLGTSALDKLPYLDFSNLKLRKSQSMDCGSVHVPRLVGDSMTDEDEVIEDERELEKEGSDLDLVRERLQDESGGMDAYSQALESIQDPKLKEIIQAIQEDEQKHQAALEQWLQENEGGSEEDEVEPSQDYEPPAEEEPVRESEKSDEESDEDFMGVADDDIIEDDDEGSGTDKADLIDDIRAVLEEHTDEGTLDKEDEETEDGEDEDEDLPFLKEDEEEEDGDEAEKRCSKSIRVPIMVSKSDQRIVYGVVSEPDTIDLQGDRLSKEEIVKACHKFMLSSQRIGKEHEGPAKADIIESYIAPMDFICGGQTVRKGSWVMAVKIHDPELWSAVKNGDITGFSIAGTGDRTPF
jgi:rubrerythrin